jgi:hypothetical protein
VHPIGPPLLLGFSVEAKKHISFPAGKGQIGLNLQASIVTVMNCEQCGCELREEDILTFQNKQLCEDCCFDLMNPPKTCDPTAVSSTLNVRKELGQKGTEGLSELQKKIYNLVVERGTIGREDLIKTLQLSPEAFEREFSVLRHCELLRGFKQDNTVYFTKY